MKSHNLTKHIPSNIDFITIDQNKCNRCGECILVCVANLWRKIDNIISISGKSGTGKTTLALYLVGKLITHNNHYANSCIWIQAHERFPITRLKQIFHRSKDILGYVKDNIYVIPQNNPISSYDQQCSIFQKMMKKDTILPPSL